MAHSINMVIYLLLNCYLNSVQACSGVVFHSDGLNLPSKTQTLAWHN